MAVRICLGQLKSYARGYLERVSTGDTLEIVRRGRLVAFILPASPSSHEPPNGTDSVGSADLAPDANIPLSHLRENAAPYFDRVAAGEIIGVVRRGMLVARIVAAASTPTTPKSLPSKATATASKTETSAASQPSQPTTNETRAGQFSIADS
jgi:antitoxin (DNA-binding transcriptional repressor) of toxin-antitoxin stability system